MIHIDDSELQFSYIRAAGPGGQNVNKVATAVQLRFDVRNSPSLPEGVRQRLVHLAGKRITADGVLVIEARRYRTQERNRRDAIERLHLLIEKSLTPPILRRPTRPSTSSVKTRLAGKKLRGAVKRSRKGHSEEMD